MVITRRDALKAAAMFAALAPAARLFAETPSLRIQRLSWAGIRLEGAESTLFIDPWISKASWGDSWPRPIVPMAASSSRRAALITHIHNDHFDPSALKDAIGEKGQLFCSDKAAPLVASKAIVTRPVELFHPESFGDFTFVPVPAADGFGEMQVSWVVKSGGMNLIHCGDTIWHSGFDAIGRVYGPFDIAFLPVNGAVIHGRTIDVDIPATLTPAQAIAAARLLRAKLVVPIHYGVSDDTYREEPNLMDELQKLAADQKVALRIVKEGDWVIA